MAYKTSLLLFVQGPRELFSACGVLKLPNNGLFQPLRVCDTLTSDRSSTPRDGLYGDYLGEMRVYWCDTSTEAPRSWVDQSPDRIMVGRLWLHYDDDPGR